MPLIDDAGCELLKSFEIALMADSEVRLRGRALLRVGNILGSRRMVTVPFLGRREKAWLLGYQEKRCRYAMLLLVGIFEYRHL